MLSWQAAIMREEQIAEQHGDTSAFQKENEASLSMSGLRVRVGLGFKLICSYEGGRQPRQAVAFGDAISIRNPDG